MGWLEPESWFRGCHVLTVWPWPSLKSLDLICSESMDTSLATQEARLLCGSNKMERGPLFANCKAPAYKVFSGDAQRPSFPESTCSEVMCVPHR